MSKDFEKAYKELAEREAPDLWDRIEDGLMERSTQSETDTGLSARSFGRKKKFLFEMRKYSAMAAAVICVIIIIPVLIRMNRSAKIFENESSGAAMDMAPPQETGGMEQAAQEAAEEECAESANGAADETAEPGSKLSEESMAVKSAADAAGDVSGQAAAATEQESLAAEVTAATEQAPSDGAERAAEPKKEAQQAFDAEEEVLFHVVLEVTGSEELLSEEDSGQNGVVYTAVVQKDPGRRLNEGDEITVFVPAYSSAALKEDASFEVDLRRQSGDDYSFTICGYHNQVVE